MIITLVAVGLALSIALNVYGYRKLLGIKTSLERLAKPRTITRLGAPTIDEVDARNREVVRDLVLKDLAPGLTRGPGPELKWVDNISLASELSHDPLFNGAIQRIKSEFKAKGAFSGSGIPLDPETARTLKEAMHAEVLKFASAHGLSTKGVVGLIGNVVSENEDTSQPEYPDDGNSARPEGYSFKT